MSVTTLSRLRALRRARALIALLALCAVLASGTAVAQEGDDQGSNDTEDASADDEKPKKKKKGKKAEDELPECEPDDDKSKKSKKGKKKAADNEEDGECVPPPRCEGSEVDLSPEEDEPNCVDQARLNRLIADFEAAAAEEATALDGLATALEGIGVLNEQLDALKLRLGEVQLRLAAAQADAGFAAIREQTAGESLDDVMSALAAEEDLLRSQAVEAYMGGDGVQLATQSAILDIEDYTELEIARQYASVVIGDQLATVDHVDALREAVKALTEVVAVIEATALADAEHVSEIEDQVAVLIGEQRRLVAEAEAEAEVIAEQIAQIQARKQAYAEELRIQGAGGGAIGQLLRQKQSDQEAPEVSVAMLAMPLEDTRIGSGFGPRVHPIFSDTRLHTGLDLSGGSGESITASADGLVVYAEETGGYGNVVVVDHGNTIATLYAHMTADAVFVGQEVVEGDLLGYVGSTGYSTGPHLHYEVRVLGTPVDPMLYLRLS